MTPNSNYILNVTFHCEHTALNDVRYFLTHRLLPNWRGVWGEVTLLALPDGQGFAVQVRHPDSEALRSFEPGEDPDVRKIMSVYPNIVTFFATLLEVIG